MAISDDDYNKARDILVKAGSETAKKSHMKHTNGKGSPTDHGLSLLREARDEFNKVEQQKMTAGRAAVVKAAAQMGITKW